MFVFSRLLDYIKIFFHYDRRIKVRKKMLQSAAFLFAVHSIHGYISLEAF